MHDASGSELQDLKYGSSGRFDELFDLSFFVEERLRMKERRHFTKEILSED